LNCDGNAANGCEVDRRSNNANCNGCGVACGAAQTCSGSACLCPAGSHPLGTFCVPESSVPRLLSPLSLGDVTQRRPTMRWVLGAPYDGAEVAICVDRACSASFPGVTATVTGNTARPNIDLPAGATVFWRVRGRIGALSESVVSTVWSFHVPHRSASGGVDTSVNPHFDVNGDGYDDLVVGAPGANPIEGAGAGTVTVYHGGPTGFDATPSRVLAGFAAGYAFGSSVAGAGDVNGDGYGDLIVGAPSGSPDGRVRLGTASIFHGGPSGIAPSAARIIAGNNMFDDFGSVVAGCGDVNGDGYADVLAANGEQVRTVSIFHGSATGIPATAARLLSGGTGSNPRFGEASAGAGDINGDGYSDVVIGASYDYNGETAFSGSVSVFLGSAGGLPATTGSVVYGVYIRDEPTSFGAAVASAGDVNGDGYSDVVVGSPNTRTNGYYGSGSASVFHGSAAGMGLTAAQTWFGESRSYENFERMGLAVASAGDVNGDGFADVVVGGPGSAASGRPSSGRVWVYYGSLAGAAASAATTLDGAAGDAFGAAVSGLGDCNGDGFSDLAVGAIGGSPGGVGSAGYASVFQGGASGVVLQRVLNGNATNGRFGTSIAGLFAPAAARDVPWCARSWRGPVPRRT
jgi:hypothetical protein